MIKLARILDLMKLFELLFNYVSTTDLNLFKCDFFILISFFYLMWIFQRKNSYEIKTYQNHYFEKYNKMPLLLGKYNLCTDQSKFYFPFASTFKYFIWGSKIIFNKSLKLISLLTRKSLNWLMSNFFSKLFRFSIALRISICFRQWRWSTSLRRSSWRSTRQKSVLVFRRRWTSARRWVSAWWSLFHVQVPESEW